jgi:hypothetical protein
MASRYSAGSYKPPSDFSGLMRQEAPKRRKTDPVEEMLRVGSMLAPAAGTAIGAGVGSMAGGIGALPGAAIGGALGAGVGGLAGYGADAMGREDRQSEDERLAREDEKRARMEMAQRILASGG